MFLWFSLESLKFYKMRNEGLVRAFFLFLLALNFLPLLLPAEARDFTPLMIRAQLVIQSKGVYQPNLLEALTPGNWTWIGLNVLLYFFNVLSLLAFVSCIAAEGRGEKAISAFGLYVKHFGSILFFALLMVLLTFFSLPVLFIPLALFVTRFAFAPILHLESRCRFKESFRASSRFLQGAKGQCFLSTAIVIFLVNGLRQLLQVIVPMSLLSYDLISGLINAFLILILGRLWALHYLYYTRFFPLMRFSATLRDPRLMLHQMEQGQRVQLDEHWKEEQRLFKERLKEHFPDLYETMLKRQEELDQTREALMREGRENAKLEAFQEDALDESGDAATSETNDPVKRKEHGEKNDEPKDVSEPSDESEN